MAKKEFVEQMFDDIAPTYDKLNHILSLNVDKGWRRKAVRRIVATRPKHVLDVACGTGDFAIALSQAGVEKVTGVDISQGMLDVGNAKVKALGLNIEMHVDDCEHLGIEDNTFDAVTNTLLRWAYKLYFLHILPFVGGLVSGNRNAYRYLPESVLRFPKPDEVCRMLKEAGFCDVEAKAFTFGLCRMFMGIKS